MAEDAEQILLVALRLGLKQHGGVPTSVKSLGDVGANELVAIVARSIRVVDEAEGHGGTVFGDKLGPGAASRHRTCTAMASKLKELGYAGDMGYNQLLYPSEAGTRALLTWLVDRLPRSGEEERTGMGDTAKAERAASTVGAWRKNAWRFPVDPKAGLKGHRFETWLPSSEEDLVTINVPKGADPGPTFLEIAAFAAVANAKATYDDLLGDKEPTTVAVAESEGGPTVALPHVDLVPGDTLPSLKEMLATLEASKGLNSKFGLGRLAHAAKFEHEERQAALRKKQDEDEAKKKADAAAAEKKEAEEKPPKEEEEDPIAKLTKELEKLGEQYRKERGLATSLEAEREALLRGGGTNDIADIQAKGKVLEKEYVVRRKTLEMLPEAAAAIAKLQEICTAAKQRIAALEAEWETHRSPLAAQIEEKKGSRAKAKARARAMVDEMKRCRADMQQMLVDLAEKDDRAKLLDAEYAKMPKHVNRALYTYRIMDIIGSVAKQKKEITKVIDDIRKVQKQNNKISDTLRRTEAIADERVYQTSLGGQDPATVQAYRSLCDLRHLFETLVTAISDTGARDREARDHETKRKQLQSRVDANNLKRILDDLHQVRTENEKLIARLKAEKR